MTSRASTDSLRQRPATWSCETRWHSRGSKGTPCPLSTTSTALQATHTPPRRIPRTGHTVRQLPHARGQPGGTRKQRSGNTESCVRSMRQARPFPEAAASPANRCSFEWASVWDLCSTVKLSSDGAGFLPLRGQVGVFKWLLYNIVFRLYVNGTFVSVNLYSSWCCIFVFHSSVIHLM